MDRLIVRCGDVTFVFRPSHNDWICNGIKLTTDEMVKTFIDYNCERLMNETCQTKTE